MKLRVLVLAVILSSIFFSLAHAQSEVRNPDIPLLIRMYPGVVTIYMAGGGQPGVKVTQGNSWSHQDIISSPSTLVIKWETNATDVWQVEVYANYTATVDQTIHMTYYGADMLGNPIGSEVSSHVIASNVWIHLSIVTLAYPRPPTLREQMEWIFVENNPIVQSIGLNTAAIDDLKNVVVILVGLNSLVFLGWVLKPIMGCVLRLIGIRH